MRLVRLPGVFPPHSDSHLLARTLARRVTRRDSVLDLCCGSGILAVTAARAGAGSVTAVDVSRRAVACTWLNAVLNGTRVRALRGDLFAPVAGERFDLIVTNPPYVPGATDPSHATGPARAWEGGAEGRALIDRICEDIVPHLRPGGRLLMVQSSVNSRERTEALLEDEGLEVNVVDSSRGEYGALLSARAPELERSGLISPGERVEDMLVVEAIR
jgi:release factor glutamine methyltransferase